MNKHVPLAASAAAVALLAPLLSSGTRIDAEEPPPRDRFGVAESPATPVDGPIYDTTTPVLSVDDPTGDVHFVVVDQSGRVVTGSGPIDDDQWQVHDGVLQPGESYAWSAYTTTGSTAAAVGAPDVLGDGTISGDMTYGAKIVEFVEEQPLEPFSINPTAGPSGQSNGLATDFFPHYDIADQVELDDDGNPVEEISPKLRPSPGSHVVSTTAGWTVVDDEHFGLCPLEERARKPAPGEFPPPPLIYEPTEAILCDVAFTIEAEATVIDDGGEAAAHNVAGRNVVPSDSMIINRDLAVDDGFVVSTTGEYSISPTFSLQTEFGFRSLGYLRVPESGTYLFGTQSPGGAEAFIYISTEDDLGKTLISDPDAWSPTTLGETYTARTERFRFENKENGSSTSGDALYNYRSRTYEYGVDDTDWIQPDGAFVRGLVDDLRNAGPRADEVRYGEPVHLEAGVNYPLAFTGWVGPLTGDIGLHVDSEITGTTPVPFDWLTPAQPGVVDFDRTMGSDVADVGAIAAAISGHGDTLAVLDAQGDLHFSSSDGGYGWTEVATLPGIATAMPVIQPTTPYDVDAGASTGAGKRHFESANGQLVGELVDGELRVFGGPVEMVDPAVQEPTTIEYLDVRFDRDGTLISGTVDGSTPMQRTDPNGLVYVGPNENGRIVLDTITDGSLSVTSGALEVVLEDDAWLTHPGRLDNRVVLALDIEPTEPAPTTVKTMAIDDAGATLVTAVDRPAIVPSEAFGGRLSLNTTGSSGHNLPDGLVTIDTIMGGGDSSLAIVDGRYSFRSDPLVLEGPEFSEPITVDALEVTFDRDFGLAEGHAAGRLVATDGVVYELDTVQAATLDLANGHVTINLSDTSQDLFHMLSSLTVLTFELEVLPGDAPAFDVAIIEKRDVEQPWSTTNRQITQLNTLLDDAGLERPAMSTESDAIQSVHISPDGNTIAVLQPVADGAGARVVIVDRDDRDDSWKVIGDVPLALDLELVQSTGSTPVGIGRDGPTRFLAVGAGNEVTIREWTPTSGWAVTDTIDVDGEVASISLDYFSEFLAIGQPDLGRVSVYNKPWWKSEWAHFKDIDQPDGFGADVGYTWKRLTVTSRDGQLVRVYRDTAPQAWGNHGDWTQSFVTGSGTAIGATTGGLDATETRTVASRQPVQEVWDRFFYQGWGPLGGVQQLTTFLR